MERKRIGESDVMEETDVVPGPMTHVGSIPEAVQITLQNDIDDKTLFNFARALKAFEGTTKSRLKKADQDSAFSLFWNTAKSRLPRDDSYDEWRFQFLQAFAKAKSPLGANHIQAALKLAQQEPPPPQCSRYASSPKIQLLIAVCFHLQKMAGDGPFFLSIRSAAKIIGTTSLLQASNYLNGLVADTILTEVTHGKPGGKSASRFRFNFASTDVP